MVEYLEKMKPSIKGSWIRALRSGQYEQGKGFLKQRMYDGTEKFCCLGVLCDLYSKANPDYKFEQTRHQTKNGSIRIESFLGNVNALPAPVAEWAGFENYGGMGPYVIDLDREPKTLAMLNDFNSWSFEQIAEVIQKVL